METIFFSAEKVCIIFCKFLSPICEYKRHFRHSTKFTIAELHEAYKAIGVYEGDGGNEAIGGIANKDRGNFHKYADKHLIKKKFIMDIGKTREGALGPPIKIYTEC